jgi:ketosteroid isomerase-like protein
MKTPCLPALALAILSGCSAARPLAVDHRAEAVKQIRAAEKAAIRAFGERNADKSAFFYAPNAALMMTNMPTVTGSEIKPLLTQMMADANFSMKFSTAKIEAAGSGDLGYTRGAYTLTMTDPKSKKILRESGKYLTVYARQDDGSWKIVDDMNNPDAPAAFAQSKE